MTIPFIGRTDELLLLQQTLEKRTASLVVIYGRRRIGKSRLIQETGRQIKTIYFSGLHPSLGLTKQEQLNEFAIQVGLEFGTDTPSYSDWSYALHDLAGRTASQKVLVVLDEITWLGYKDPSFLGKLKIAWDKYFINNPNLTMILCGSVSAWIENNIIASTGFYGRISLKLRLRELPLNLCKQFWGDAAQNISPFEIIKLLAVTGGVPKYLEEIDPMQSAEENIRKLCFQETGILFNDFQQIFTDTLQSYNEAYGKIVRLLADGYLNQATLTKHLELKSGGNLSSHLRELTAAGFISKYNSWNLKTRKASKLNYYRLSDNYLRFYLKYILPNSENIISGNFQNKTMSSLPGWSSIMALQIENLVINNRDKVINLLGIPREEIICDGPYFQRKTARHAGCQIDYLIQTEFNNLYLCEIKFGQSVIRDDIIQEVKAKIEALNVPKHFSIRPILIHLGELHENVIAAQYFAKTIEVTSLLEGK